MTRLHSGVLAALVAAVATLPGCATTPEEDPVLQQKLGDLDTRLARIDRVVSNNSLLEISNQMEGLRADLRSMHNDVDQINHALDADRKHERDLYADIDQRLKALESRAGAAPPAAAAGVPAAGAAEGASGAGVNDSVSYQAAFSLLKNGQYGQAIPAFQSFLSTYPSSPLADNAQYWLGEAYYVNRSFPEALAAFQRMIDKYPQSRKLPDAQLKVGYCEYELNQWQAARDALSQVQARYPDAPAAHLAEQRLQKMTDEKH